MDSGVQAVMVMGLQCVYVFLWPRSWAWSKQSVGFNQLGQVGRCWAVGFKLGRGRQGHVKGQAEVEKKRSEGKGSWVAGGMWGDWSRS